MAYYRRIIDDLLDEVFTELPAIALEGAKGVGKTASATQRASTTLTLTNAGERAAITSNPSLIKELKRPLFVDEWQLAPEVWDIIRHNVDDGAGGGSYLLAGSAGPKPGVRIHSGAGRIVSVTMRPLSLTERGLCQPTVSLADLISGGSAPVAGTSTLSAADYADEILRSGFPGIRHLPDRARNLQLDSYITRIVDSDLPENGVIIRRPAALRSWLAAYAAGTATDASYSTLLDAATPGESEKPARQTADNYRDHLRRIFVLDPVEAWIPSFSPLTRLKRTPKHHLVDPALAARLVGVGRTGLLTGQGKRVDASTGTWFGALFESLATQSVRVYAGACEARVGHLRTRNSEREIDLIVETADRRVVAIEVKLADRVTDSDVRHLNWLHRELGDRVVDRVVLYSGEFAYRRADGVAVVPLALLGP